MPLGTNRNDRHIEVVCILKRDLHRYFILKVQIQDGYNLIYASNKVTKYECKVKRRKLSTEHIFPTKNDFEKLKSRHY